MPLHDVDVTRLEPARFRNVLAPEALAAFERTIARGRELLGRAHGVERQLDRARRRRRRDAAVAARLRAGSRRGRALGGDRRRSRLLRRHEAAAQPAARP